MSVGLHLDLGEWAYDGEAWVPVYQVVPLDDLAVVAEELERQLSDFRRLVGRDPTHLDSHQHVHQDEPVRSAALELARRLDVPLRHFSPEHPVLWPLLWTDGAGTSLTGSDLGRVAHRDLDGFASRTDRTRLPSRPIDAERSRRTASSGRPRWTSCPIQKSGLSCGTRASSSARFGILSGIDQYATNWRVALSRRASAQIREVMDAQVAHDFVQSLALRREIAAQQSALPEFFQTRPQAIRGAA